ncbi:MAG: hypothetical protein QF570_12615 [Myxococcota bacterium]|nr:hypothetical protein [Myxococcota bacterium]
MKILKAAIVLAGLLGCGFGIAWAATVPAPLPSDTVSAGRLTPGPFAVERRELTWVDESRPMASNGDFEGAATRTFAVALWAPGDAPGPHPLVVYSHGFMSNRHGGAYLAEHLAGHGYVVVSVDYPLTHYAAPGGPNANDVANQPADVSFLIDRVLALKASERPFAGEIDRDRIGLFGLSLGGLTTTLAAFDPNMRDRRVSAAISIAGPAVFFGPRFFEHADVPFLMIAGTADAMVDYEANAEPFPDLVRQGGLVTISGATHAGFSNMASGLMRVLGNPDSVGCTALMFNLDIEPGENHFEDLGNEASGYVDASNMPLPCEREFSEVMAAGHQHLITTVAVRAFFESQFARDAADREAHARFLTQTLPSELEVVSYTPTRR